jgi:hypothetical protein
VDGHLRESTVKIPVESLVAYISHADHGNVQIPDASCSKLRVMGLTEGHNVAVFSTEIEDHILLVRPSTTLPSGIRHASLVSSGGENSFVSAEKIIVYEPSHEIERLTDEQWALLKQSGYVAVHNNVVGSETVTYWGTDLAGRVKKFFAPIEEHHLFQTMNGVGEEEKALKPRAKAFWKSLGINPDEFVVPWERTEHQKAHRTAITSQWQEFIKANSPSTGVVPATNISQIRRKALDLVHKQVGDFQIPIERMTRYRRALGKKLLGDTLEQFYRLDELTHHPHLSTVENRTKHLLRWSPHLRKIASFHSSDGFRKLLPAFQSTLKALEKANLVMRALTIFEITTDFEGWLAATLGLHRAEVHMLLMTPLAGKFDDYHATGAENFQLKDGNFIWRHMSTALYEVSGSNNNVTNIMEGEIQDIKPTSTPGVANVVIEYKKTGHVSSTIITLPFNGLVNEQIANQAEIGKPLPWNPGYMFTVQ